MCRRSAGLGLRLSVQVSSSLTLRSTRFMQRLRHWTNRKTIGPWYVKARRKISRGPKWISQVPTLLISLAGNHLKCTPPLSCHSTSRLRLTSSDRAGKSQTRRPS